MAIFIATFFNTAILFLLANANTKGTVLRWLPFRGIYNDLDQDWYLNVGPTLIYTMQINAIYVYADFCIYYFMGLFYKWRDSGTCCASRRKKTKCVTQQQYIALYAGPDYLIFYKYATILNTVWVTFMYGVALPILFPIAAWTFFNLFVVDSLTLTYFFKQPPNYDEALNNSALNLLRWAPVFMLFFGYWCLGQQQIFSNTINPIGFSNEPAETSHSGVP